MIIIIIVYRKLQYIVSSYYQNLPIQSNTSIIYAHLATFTQLSCFYLTCRYLTQRQERSYCTRAAKIHYEIIAKSAAPLSPVSALGYDVFIVGGGTPIRGDFSFNAHNVPPFASIELQRADQPGSSQLSLSLSFSSRTWRRQFIIIIYFLQNANRSLENYYVHTYI